MRRLPILLAALMLSVATSCRPRAAQDTVLDLSEADRQGIQSVSEQFRRNLLAKHTDSLSNLYTEDAVVMPPNHPPVAGQNAIREWQAGYPPVADFALTNEKIEGIGDLAYVRGRYVMTVAGAPADTGKFVEIRRRQPDGSWKIAVDMFSSNLAAPTPPKP